VILANALASVMKLFQKTRTAFIVIGQAWVRKTTLSKKVLEVLGVYFGIAAGV